MECDPGKLSAGLRAMTEETLGEMKPLIPAHRWPEVEVALRGVMERIERLGLDHLASVAR
jgi:hypothetical protein